jgi:hypothetical protein
MEKLCRIWKIIWRKNSHASSEMSVRNIDTKIFRSVVPTGNFESFLRAFHWRSFTIPTFLSFISGKLFLFLKHPEWLKQRFIFHHHIQIKYVDWSKNEKCELRRFSLLCFLFLFNKLDYANSTGWTS